MNYYLIIIESKINPKESLVSVFKGKQQFSKNDLNPIISLVEKFVNCFLYDGKKTQDQMGKLSFYKLTDIGKLSFFTEYPTEKTLDEEDLETGKVYEKPVMEKDQYELIHEGNLIQQWENYDSFKDEMKLQ